LDVSHAWYLASSPLADWLSYYSFYDFGWRDAIRHFILGDHLALEKIAWWKRVSPVARAKLISNRPTTLGLPSLTLLFFIVIVFVP